MDHEHALIRSLKQRWDEEDKVCDEQEGRAKMLFLKQEANELFAPIENYFTKLGKVLPTVGASVELDGNWEYLGDQKLRRIAKVTSSKSTQQLHLELTIEGCTIFYRDKPHRFFGGVETLVPAITSDVEQFLSLQSPEIDAAVGETVA